MFSRLRLLVSVMIVGVFLHGTVMAATDEKAAPEAAATPASSTDDLAKKSQNPIADMMSVPIQYNLYTHGALGNSTMSQVLICV